MGAQAVVQVIIVAAAAAAAIYMSHQLSKKLGKGQFRTSPVVDDEGPSTNVNRGAFIPYVIGRARVGVLYGWTGNRSTTRNPLSPANVTKGRKKKRRRLPPPPSAAGFLESGFLPICVGPAFELVDLYFSGKSILIRGNPALGGAGTFTSTTVPSGSTLAGNPGGIPWFFRVYWGELDQPGDILLTDAVQGMGSTSRWPGLMYLLAEAPLGSPPRWPTMDIEILTGIQDTGTVSLVLSPEEIASATYTDLRKGLNGAHIMAQLLFGSYPYGIGLDPLLFDIPSLEAVGQLLETEAILSSIAGEGGETFQALLGQLMQDLGVMISWVPEVGKWRFVLIRAPVSSPVIPAAMVATKPVESQVRHTEAPVERAVFRFFDVDRRFRPSTIDIGSDSATLGDRPVKIKTVQLRTTVDHQSASKIAERRSQEVLGDESRYKMTLNRAASNLYPGRTFFVSGIASRLRVLTNKLDVLSGAVKIEAMGDAMGVDPSTFFLNPPVEAAPVVKAVGVDISKKIIEAPLFMLDAVDSPTILIPRIRSHDQIIRADFYLSDDNVTYALFGSSPSVQSGGVLAPSNPLPPGVPILETGPEITLLGDDDDVFQDLSTNLSSWRAGDQVVCINGELMFVREFVALGAGVWRMDGIIRARMGTVQGNHLANDDVFVFDPNDVFGGTDSMFISANEVFIKTNPQTLGANTDLAAEVAVSRILYMTGHRPLPPVNLRVNGQSNVFPTGQDVVLNWSYKSRGGGQTTAGNNGSGAGMVNGGQAVQDAAPEGDAFILRFFDDPTGANTLVRTETLAPGANGLQSFTYTNANLVSDLGAEEDFAVEITERGNGLESFPVLRLIVEFI